MTYYIVEYSLEILEHNSGEFPRSEKRLRLVTASSPEDAEKTVEKYYANRDEPYCLTHSVTIIRVTEHLNGG
jgi:hypothetical protein